MRSHFISHSYSSVQFVAVVSSSCVRHLSFLCRLCLSIFLLFSLFHSGFIVDRSHAPFNHSPNSTHTLIWFGWENAVSVNVWYSRKFPYLIFGKLILHITHIYVNSHLCASRWLFIYFLRYFLVFSRAHFVQPKCHAIAMDAHSMCFWMSF